METKIYTLSSSKSPNIIRYVGKTNGSLKKRLSGHITLAKINSEKKYGHNYTSNWINKELGSGNYIIIEELDLTIQDNWEYLERYWISQFKSWGFKLTNLTDGGDGNKGQFFSKESNIARGNKLRGIPSSENVRKNISIGSTGKILTDKHKENVRYWLQVNGVDIKYIKMFNDVIKQCRVLEFLYLKQNSAYNKNLEAEIIKLIKNIDEDEQHILKECCNQLLGN